MGIFYAVLLISFSTYADTNSDTNRLFNWAQENYSSIFSTNEITKAILLPESSRELAGSWLYRFYPETNVYAGVLNEQEVFVLGGPWPELLYVGTLNELISVLPPQSTLESQDCVNRLTLVAVGTQYNTLSTSADGLSSSEFHVTHDEVTGEFIRVTNTPINNSFGLISTETLSKYRHDSGFIYISQLAINTIFNSTASNTKVNFSPERQSIGSPACIGQTVTRNFVKIINQTTDGMALPTRTESFVGSHTVESINEIKTVAAGTFNTVLFRDTNSSDGSYSLQWTDILTGVLIASEDYDVNNSRLSTFEITTLTIP